MSDVGGLEEKPKHFYKYREVSQYTGRILTHNEIFFAYPSEFNDPFDSKIYFATDITEAELKDFAIAVAQRQEPNASLNRWREIAYETMMDILSTDPQDYDRSVQEFMTQELDKYLSIFSMSTKRDDILMWSHYAKSHQGICLEFESRFKPFSEWSRQVIYSTYHPQGRFFGDMKNAIGLILTKSAQWSYECEWRMLSHVHGVRKFDPKALTGVILGCAIRPEDEAQVVKWAKARRHKPKLYRAERHPHEFALNIVEVRTNKP